MEKTFRFEITQSVKIAISGEAGEIRARAEYSSGEPQYLLHYKAADGRAVEAWWCESQLSPVAY